MNLGLFVDCYSVFSLFCVQNCELWELLWCKINNVYIAMHCNHWLVNSILLWSVISFLIEVSLEGELVFTVEIPKQNNSIGLTISGKELPSHPITISEITAGGVAERWEFLYSAVAFCSPCKNTENVLCWIHIALQML